MIRFTHLDSHVVIWLYAGEHHRIGAAARKRLTTDIVKISPMVRLELAYLAEVGRITDPPERILRELEGSIGLALDDQPFDRVADVAAHITFTRDPFDRIIVAQAIVAKARLITKDERIHAALPRLALWD